MRVVSFKVGQSRGKALMVLTTICLFIFFLFRGVHNLGEQIISIEIFSMKHPGKVSLDDRKLLNKFGASIVSAEVLEGEKKIKGNYKLIIKKKKKEDVYLFDNDEFLLEEQKGRVLVLQDPEKILDSLMKELERKNPYGEFLTWDEVNKVFLKFDHARIRDLDTGKTFMVQRRAGSKHADVQPLTAKDSAVMKEIYGGRWSWRRRAIIVEIKGQRIAASMNGMPHGAGAISGNDFNGHFCIHFRDCKTHTNRANLAHQLMVWKAAGVVWEMVSDADPKRMMDITLTALEQKDYKMAVKMMALPPGLTEAEAIKLLYNIKWIALSEVGEPRAEGGIHTFELKASYQLTNDQSFVNLPVNLNMVSGTGKAPWKFDFLSVRQLLEQ